MRTTIRRLLLASLTTSLLTTGWLLQRSHSYATEKPEADLREQMRKLTPLQLVGRFQELWSGPQWSDETQVVFEELRDRKDPEVDRLLINWCRTAHEEDVKKGVLDRDYLKRPSSQTEYVMGLIQKRQSPAGVEFLVSMATNVHAMVRAAAAGSLGQTLETDPKQQQVLGRLLLLLQDTNPTVAMRASSALTLDTNSCMNADVARALVRAAARATNSEVRVQIQKDIKKIERQLNYRRKKLPEAERKQVDAVLNIIQPSTAQ